MIVWFTFGKGKFVTALQILTLWMNHFIGRQFSLRLFLPWLRCGLTLPRFKGLKLFPAIKFSCHFFFTLIQLYLMKKMCKKTYFRAQFNNVLRSRSSCNKYLNVGIIAVQCQYIEQDSQRCLHIRNVLKSKDKVKLI